MRPRRQVALVAGGAALALAVAACGSSSKPATTGGASASGAAPASAAASASGGAVASGSAAASGSASASGGGSGDGVSYAQGELAKFMGSVSGTPTGATIDVSAAKGKVVYYVPIGLTIPYFQSVLSGVQAAAKAAGLTVSPCDPKFSPSGVAQCLNQAANQGAGGVILDTIPLDFAGQAVSTVTGHHIPILVAEEPLANSTESVASVTPDTNKQEALSAGWIIADSGGKANILLPEITDESSSIGYVEKGSIPEIRNHCPGCTLKVIKTNTEQLGNLPSLISTTLVSNPKINYVMSEFDADVSAIIAGLQTSSGGRKIKVTGINGVLSSLQNIKQGNYQVADTGDNGYQLGWAAVDQLLRQILHKPLATGEPVGLKVFTKDNVGGLTLTPAAANSGAWYGSTDFVTAYKKMWGVG